MQIGTNLPVQFLNNPQPNQGQQQQAGNADGAPRSHAANPAAAVNPSGRAQVAQQAGGSEESTESSSVRAQEASNGSEGSRLDIFA